MDINSTTDPEDSLKLCEKSASTVPGAEHLINISIRYYYYKRVILFFFCIGIRSTDVQILIVNICINDMLPGNYDF